MKVARLQRVLRLLTVLQSDRYYRPSELAQKLGVSRRTVFRDLEVLYQAGIPCYYDEQRGGYKIAQNFFLPPLNLQLSEALALLLAAQSAGGRHGLPLLQAAQDAALKIESALPAHVRQYCGSLLRHVTLRQTPHARHEELDDLLSLLQRAIRQRRQVNLTYISFLERRQITTVLNPYHLHFAERAWYVIGYSSLHRQVRTFKLGRIKHARLLDAAFTLRRPFRLDEYLGDAWSLIPEGRLYQVELRFAPKVAGNVAEVLWHRKQQLAWRDDGALTFRVQVDGLGEITWWILSYGDQVQVLKPAALRRRVAEVAANVLSLYRNGPQE